MPHVSCADVLASAHHQHRRVWQDHYCTGKCLLLLIITILWVFIAKLQTALSRPALGGAGEAKVAYPPTYSLPSWPAVCVCMASRERRPQRARGLAYLVGMHPWARHCLSCIGSCASPGLPVHYHEGSPLIIIILLRCCSRRTVPPFIRTALCLLCCSPASGVFSCPQGLV